MMGKRDERAQGQNTIEMVFLIAAIALTVLGLQTQVKRAMAGRVRASLNQLSQQHFDPNGSYNVTTRITGGDGETTVSQTTTGETHTTGAETVGTTVTSSYHLGSIAESTVVP